MKVNVQSTMRVLLNATNGTNVLVIANCSMFAHVPTIRANKSAGVVVVFDPNAYCVHIVQLFNRERNIKFMLNGNIAIPLHKLE